MPLGHKLKRMKNKASLEQCKFLGELGSKIGSPDGAYNILQEYPSQYLKMRKESLQVSGILDDVEPLIMNTGRTKRNPLVWAGLGWVIYLNKGKKIE